MNQEHRRELGAGPEAEAAPRQERAGPAALGPSAEDVRTSLAGSEQAVRKAAGSYPGREFGLTADRPRPVAPAEASPAEVVTKIVELKQRAKELFDVRARPAIEGLRASAGLFADNKAREILLQVSAKVETAFTKDECALILSEKDGLLRSLEHLCEGLARANARSVAETTWERLVRRDDFREVTNIFDNPSVMLNKRSQASWERMAGYELRNPDHA